MATSSRSSTGRPHAATTPQRRDIQGLRALAVGLVILYHLRPQWLPGGFAGVDVFFVISGFLIIGTLAAEIRRTGTIRIRDFYARRIRRLMPAASVVLLATIAVTALFLPVSRWPSTMSEVVASALNVQNWALAAKAADYAEATAAASPVQHFWSLSVEEQFYLVIPLVLLLGAWVARRRRWDTARCVYVAIALVTAASFVFSVVFSELDHGRAYFVTPTRMWELGIGGLAAMAAHRLRPRRALRLVLGWGGLAAVALSAFTLNTEMAFPGYVALLPTLGTTALLVAGLTGDEQPSRAETAKLLGLQPLRYVGDISYSLYLWHWPVIVIVLQLSDGVRLTRGDAALVLAVSLALAAASAHGIETPFRRGRVKAFVHRPRTAYLFGAALVAASVVTATAPWQYASAELDRLAASMTLDDDHPGALALDPAHPRPAPPGVPLMPDPAVATQDWGLTGLPGCSTYDITKPVAGDACQYGNPAAPKKVVLVGDSHAAMYATVLGEFVRLHPQWRAKVMVRNGCPFTAIPPAGLSVCADQNQAELTGILALKPDLVITTAMSPESYAQDLKWRWDSRTEIVDGYKSLLQRLSDAGIRTSIIRDVPRPRVNTPLCLERNRDRPSACDTPRATAFGPENDPLVEAGEAVGKPSVVDLTPWLCPGTTCPAVVGNVVVYRDNHLTNSYVKTLYVPLTTGLGLV